MIDDELWKGVEVDQVSVWVDPEDRTVILQVTTIPGSPQIRIPAAKWLQIVDFVAGPAVDP